MFMMPLLISKGFMFFLVLVALIYYFTTSTTPQNDKAFIDPESKSLTSSVTLTYQINNLIKDSVPFPPYKLSFNRRSQFYGLQYKETYGKPLSAFGFSSFKQTNLKWTNFFPDLVQAFRMYEKVNSKQITEFFTSSFKAFAVDKRFHVGDTFEVTLQAIDARGLTKTFGGDYLRARLIEKREKYPNGIACNVRDNGNGTYTVIGPLVQKGKFILDVKLVLSLEGIYELDQQQSALRAWGQVNYTCHLESGESTPCDVIKFTAKAIFKDKPICDYTNPRNKEPWFSVKPSSGNCSRIVYITNKGDGLKTLINFDKFCKNFTCHNSISTGVTVVVSPSNQTSRIAIGLPNCKQLYKKSNLPSSVTGFFSRFKWISLQCNKTKLFPKNKVFYLFGDSTVRQFYYLFVKWFNLHDFGDNSHVIWQQPRIATSFPNQNINFTMYYRAHGPPLQNPGPPHTRPYISDSIDGISHGGEGVYILFNVGLHLLHYDPSIYIHRLRGIRQAVLNHHAKHPETKFLVKGLTVVEHKFEWNIYRFEVILREMFRFMNNVVFINFWDVSTVWNYADYHVYGTPLVEEADLILNYLV